MASQPDFESLPPEVFVKMGTTKAAMADRMALMNERDAKTPPVGSVAPDFEIERLSPNGTRTGETFKLSSTRGRPVALVFGSYT